MDALFLYGTLCDSALLRIVLGACADRVRTTPAMLPDHAVAWAEGLPFSTIIARPGAEAVGVLLHDLEPQARARLDFYEGGHDGALHDATVRTDSGDTHPARAFFPAPGRWTASAPFDLAAWQGTWGALCRAAAVEAMEYFGTCSPQALAGRMPMIRARAASRLAATGVPAELRSATHADTVETIGTKILHAGFFRTEAHELRHPTFTGGMSDPMCRELFVATDAALVLPYDPLRDRVLLVEQFRMGAYGRGDPRPWTLEPVAGRVDPGETPEHAAHRECAEEAGLTLTRLEKVAGYYPTPGYSTEYFHNFVGIADLPDDLPRHGGLDSEAEDIRLHVLDFDAAMALLVSGEADDGPLILSLLWLSRERGRLRAAA